MSHLKIPTSQLVKELKEINPSLNLVENPNRPGLSNIMMNGVDIVIGIPNDFLQESHSPSYCYTFPNGMSAPFKTYTEAIELTKATLEKLSTNKEFAELFYAQE